jgi:hypothetical protein
MTQSGGWLDDSFTGHSVIQAFLHNQADVADLLARATGGRHVRLDGLALADSGGPVMYTNQAVLLRPVLTPDDALLDEIERFFTGSHPAMVLSAWPTPNLTARGWQLIGHPMFVVRAPGRHETPSPPGVTVVRVDNAVELAMAERVAIDGYPLPEAEGLPAYSLLGTSLLDGPLRIRVAYVDGRPAALGSGHTGHGVVNLCLAATMAAARRRGAWRSLVWARVDDAPDLPAAAFTSDDSRPGFLRLGFLPITRFTLWLKPGVRA